MELIKPGHYLYKLLEYSIQIDSIYLLNLLFEFINANYVLMPTCLEAETGPLNKHVNCHILLIFKAIQFDSVNSIKYLISKGTHVNCFPTKIRHGQICEVFSYTPLHYAVDIEMYNSAEMLLKNGISAANPNIAANVVGIIKTPLNSALNRCNEKMANLLLEHGANSMLSRQTFDDLVTVVTSNGAQSRKNPTDLVKQNIFAAILGEENRKILDEFLPTGENLKDSAQNTQQNHTRHKSNHFTLFNYFAAMATLRGDLIMTRMLDKKFAAFIWANSEIVQVTRLFFTQQKNKNSFLNWLPTDMILLILGLIIQNIILDLKGVISAP